MSNNDLNNFNKDLSPIGSSENASSERTVQGFSPVLSPVTIQNPPLPGRTVQYAASQTAASQPVTPASQPAVTTTPGTTQLYNQSYSQPASPVPQRPGSAIASAQQSVSPVLGPTMSMPSYAQNTQTGPAAPLAYQAQAQAQAQAQMQPQMQAQASAGKKKAPKQGRSGARIAALAVSFALIGALAGGATMALLARSWSDQAREDAIAAAKRIAKGESDDSDNGGSSKNGQSNILQGNREYTPINTANVDTNQKHTPSEIYAANVNSTVGITTSIDYNYYGYKTTAAASGSGFIFSDDGYIVTNYHVVEGSSSIKVTTYDGKQYDAVFIGYDESNDLAVLKIEADNLVPVILGDSDKMNVGDDVLAIGNPLGELTFSLTTGCVSALNREVTIDKKPMNLIQTDCAINAGNSGGALFNLYGEVIGITNAKYSNAGAQGEASIENIGFAIPMNSVKDIIADIIETGFITKPYIGISCQAVTNRMQSYGLPEGISIEEIIPDGPADKAGLQVNDIITEINGKEVPTTDALRSAIDSCGIGGQMKIKVFRQGNYIDIDLTVEEQKAPSTQSSKKG